MSENTEFDVGALVWGLRNKLQSGANVHTINKAIFHLRDLSKPVRYIEDDTERVERFIQHAKNCQNAIDSNSVEELAKSMRHWF